MCVVVFVVVRGRAHWHAACSAACCQGLNRAASEVRFRGEKQSSRPHPAHSGPLFTKIHVYVNLFQQNFFFTSSYKPNL